MNMWSSSRRVLQDLLSLSAVRSFCLTPAQVSVSAHFNTNVIIINLTVYETALSQGVSVIKPNVSKQRFYLTASVTSRFTTHTKSY